MSFASEPGRDDSNLPPVNIVIPDDARELDRDVLAYRREQRARRRRQRVTRIFGLFGRREFGGHAAILPLIATCVALSMLAGAMLSVITISPASAPTVPPSAVATAPPSPASTAPPAASPATQRIALPAGTVRLDDKTVPIHSLARSALALVPASCRCGPALQRLAYQAARAHVRVYFVGADPAMPQVTSLATTDGAGVAKPVYDKGNVLGAAYHAVGLTVLLVHSDFTAEVRRNLPADFQLGPDLRDLAVGDSQATAAAAVLPKAEPSRNGRGGYR